jgi:Family of unknown function (DUF5995)
MFAYDPALITAVQTPANSIADVLRIMRTIDAACIDGDGLKWFNWLYLQVTSAVEARVAAGGFAEPAWLSELDVQFARLYFGALQASLTGAECPGCWQALFECRNQAQIARIQFALAGINAHINHDLCEAIVATCQATGTVPRHGTPQYDDYTALNTTLDSLIDAAKRTLHVRLLGDPLPAVSQLENLIAAWGVSAAREKAWTNGEVLWYLQSSPDLFSGFLDSLDGLTTFGGKALLVPVP